MKQVYRIIAKKDKKRTVYSPMEMSDIPDEIYDQVSTAIDRHVHLWPNSEDNTVILFSANAEALTNFIYGISFHDNEDWTRWFEDGTFTFDYLA